MATIGDYDGHLWIHCHGQGQLQRLQRSHAYAGRPPTPGSPPHRGGLVDRGFRPQRAGLRGFLGAAGEPFGRQDAQNLRDGNREQCPEDPQQVFLRPARLGSWGVEELRSWRATDCTPLEPPQACP